MQRLWSLVLLAAVAVPAMAQEPPPRDSAAPPPPRSGGRAGGFNFFNGPDQVRVQTFQRGRLGILVDLTADPARDSIGALVAGLTPGGAAEKAGVKTGDLVVRLNGTALVRRAGRNEGGDEEEPQSRPGMRLIELASRLDPGDSVRLELRRGTQSVNLTVVAGESGMDEIRRTLTMEVRPDEPLADVERDGRAQNFVFSGGPFADIELVKVNSGLAEYFGTSEGLLVVNVGDDSTFGLRNGDVILAIGGRKPLSPAHALRILGTYESNESVSFDIMRMKHRTTVSGKMPARRSAGWSVTPNSFDFDMPMQWMRGLDELQELPKMLLPLPNVPALPTASERVIKT